ncbi:MAG TPA: hypothetical protein VFU10_03430 [Gaiellaceae bacterium]|nr:hypothetical protein [Gaiellaceae bacterium]
MEHGAIQSLGPMRVVLLDAAAGGFLLAAIAVAAQRRGSRARSRRVRFLGWVLVAVPLSVAVMLHLLVPLPTSLDQAAFLAGVAAFAVGAALVLRRDEDDWREAGEAPSPPWWPAFERDLGDYERERSRRETVPR